MTNLFQAICGKPPVIWRAKQVAAHFVANLDQSVDEFLVHGRQLHPETQGCILQRLRENCLANLLSNKLYFISSKPTLQFSTTCPPRTNTLKLC